MTKKRNYYNLFEQELNSLTKRQRILVHVCCGPCSMYPLKVLNEYFDITIYYSNPNIYPQDEYQLRLNELIRYLNVLGNPYQLIIPDYKPKEFLKKVWKYKEAKEGGLRCLKCYAIRMEEAARYAAANNFKYFTTIMSISSHKNAYYINELGQLMAKQHHINFIHSDFKKHEGSKKNSELNKKYDIYRQDYCGCIFSLIDRNKKADS